jgi:hypothetical protein
MDQSEQSDCDRLSRDITGLLKSISSGGDVEPLLIVMCCEVIPPSIGEWYDQVCRSMQYTAPVACRPWKRMNAGLVASTANELCSLLLRSFLLKLMPDRPIFFGSSTAFSEAAERFEAYVATNEESFWQRFDQTCESANFPQWLIVASMADRERATMLEPSIVPGKLVTIDEVAAMLVDVEAKTLHNSDVKSWGAPDGKVNRSRAWNLDRIRPIIEQTRQFKDV